MAIEPTIPPLAPESTISILSLQDLDKRLPLHILQFIRQWVDLGPDSNLTMIGHASLDDQATFAPLFNNGEKSQVMLINFGCFDEFKSIRKYLLKLNEGLELNGCLVGYISSTPEKEQRRRPFSNNHHAKKNVQWLYPDIETCGWFFAHGFELLNIFETPEKDYFVAQKIKDRRNEPKTNHGPIIRLKRLGQHGKLITVYKFRTMYPYSEYIQEYVYEHVGLQSGGKIYKDPRVTPLGHLLRRYWLDELPMLYNLLKGDLKLFGVRPLSEHYLSLYPEECQKYRIQFKPGLIPPFYADLPKTVEEIAASEHQYLKAYERHPLRTDWRYFWKAAFNIIFKGIRSG